MSHKTTDTLDEHTKQLGFCAIQVSTGEYMDVPSSVKNQEEFEAFLKHFNGYKEVFRFTYIIASSMK